jgi:hypothetical protein
LGDGHSKPNLERNHRRINGELHSVISWVGSLSVWIIALAIIAGLNVLIRLVPIVAYVRALYRGARRPLPTATRWPHISLFIPVRGGTDEAKAALEHLLALEYPRFDVHVIVDHPTDPAMQAISTLCRERNDPRLKVDFLREPAANRSLYCSALVQFFEQLDESCELIGFCGTDVQLPRWFLHEMAAPVSDPAVGSTLGNRWYQPQKSSWGSLVRYVWNAAAVVFMWVDQEPWGGASVLRPDDVRRSGLLETWRAGMVEDAPIKAAIQKLNLRMVFVPKLLVVNRDELDLKPCYDFLKRQFLWTRLYHPNWFLVPLSVLVQTVVMFLPWLLGIVAFVLGNSGAGLIAVATGLVFWCCEMAKLLIVDKAARRIATANEQPIPPTSWGVWFRIFLAIPLTQIVSFLAVFAAARLTRVQWSGIEYEIRGQRDIRRLHYFPVSARDPTRS